MDDDQCDSFGGAYALVVTHGLQVAHFNDLAGVVIGGVSFYGGRGSAVGTFFGVLFIQLVQSGLVIAGFDAYLQTPVLGFLLVAAAVLDVLRNRRKES